jgi:voltage-gated sodium channel
LWHLKEPERTGLLADIVRNRWFEKVVQFVILSNCLEMGLSANYEMEHVPEIPDGLEWTAFTVFDIIFQIFYTVELVLKLAVHREFFFWNEDFGFNTFDVFLVISGYVELIFESQHGGSTALRTVRILKLGKALRAVKIVAGFRTLRAILVCIQGSFITLLWSVLMLCVVFYIFSLIFVQQAASRISVIGDIHDPEVINLLGSFRNVQTSILTLSKASLGGDDWGVALDVLKDCDDMTIFFYLLFVAFSQIALINIITGIFVDNAMQSLAPSKDQLATSLDEEEGRCARELEKLCSDVDADHSGCLTKEQFNDGAAGAIPSFLQLLGLSRDNVKLFFEILCDASPDKQVDIKSFVRGCMRLKGAATSFDLQSLASDLSRIERTMAREFRGMSERMANVEECMGSGPSGPVVVVSQAGMSPLASPRDGCAAKSGHSRNNEGDPL